MIISSRYFFKLIKFVNYLKDIILKDKRTKKIKSKSNQGIYKKIQGRRRETRSNSLVLPATIHHISLFSILFIFFLSFILYHVFHLIHGGLSF